MTDYVKEMSLLCAERNTIVGECRKNGDLSLDEFLDIQAAKVRTNSKISPFTSPDDFYRISAEYVESRLDKEAAREVDEALRAGVINTADHHGALFDSLSFQGDLLFGELLHKLGYTGRYIPIHAGSQVELGNVTYARGFCVYLSAAEKRFIPLFPSKERQMLSSHAHAVTPEMIENLHRHLDESDEPGLIKDSVKEVCDIVWADTPLPESGRYSDQVVSAGVKLSEVLFDEGAGPVLTYIELEEIANAILKEEIRGGDSLIHHILYDPKIRKTMQEQADPGTIPIADLLFGNVDERGRKSFLNLSEDNELCGTGWHGEEIRYKADAETLCRLLDERRIFPGALTIAIVLAFERGITWMGGMFQAIYLPEWQNRLAKLLAECGYKSEAEHIMAYDCSGYICGPMFAQYEGEGFVTTAGPIEFYLTRPSYEAFRETMLATGLWDAHLIGLAAIYHDLISPAEREEGWYGKITTELYGRFPNALSNMK